MVDMILIHMIRWMLLLMMRDMQTFRLFWKIGLDTQIRRNGLKMTVMDLLQMHGVEPK